MTRRLSPIALCAVIAMLVAAATSFGHPAGKTTLEETALPGPTGGFQPVVAGRGEGFTVLSGLGAKPRKARSRTRRSIIYFGQLTDPQLADEMSPLRLEALDPGGPPEGGKFSSAWRPQEALGPQLWDQAVRNMNLNRTSPVRQGDRKRKRMGFVLATGDLADNQHTNETKWYVTIMDGGTVDPFSGKPISPSNPCDASAEDIARMNDDVANRRYTGVQDYSDWPATAAMEKRDGFWDPDEAPPTAASPYADFPRYPGLMDRAQQPFVAQGLNVPWYAVRGNHDGLVSGVFAATGIFRALATSCLKVYPNKDLDEDRYADDAEGECRLCDDLGNSAFVQAQLANGGKTPPDPERKLVTPPEYKALHGKRNDAHGWGFVNRTELRRSRQAAAYYAFTRNGIRFIGIDTVAEAGGESGNVDDPQYRWLERELKSAQRKGLLIVPFGHHTLETMDVAAADEEADPCGSPPEPGCDLDPRSSKPIHRGTTGAKSIKSLFLKYRNVIAYVNGHTHDNAITGFRKNGRGFWSINTSAIADWPQQSRLIDVMNNRDGSLSIFATMIDHASPLNTPDPGAANVFTDAQLGSIARRLTLNDPHAKSNPRAGVENPRGRLRDRNVELLIPDPR